MRSPPLRHEVEQGVETLSIMDLFGPIAVKNNDGRLCIGCGSELKLRATAKYCSKACGRRHRDSLRVRSEIDAAKDAKAPGRQCVWCFEIFKSHRKEQRYCDKTCSTAANIALRWARVSRMRVSYSVCRPICRCCGVRYTATVPQQRLCSSACREIDSRIRSLKHNTANDNRDRASRPCAECGIEFSPEYGNKRRLYCAQECMRRRVKRVSKVRRRAAERGVACEPVDPFTVFDRDGWVCQICGIETPRDRRGTCAADAPELDHIHPLSKGGAHTHANTQCACRSCNSMKSDALPAVA